MQIRMCANKKLDLIQKQLIFIFLFTGLLSSLQAQNELGNLEFIENKGQWDHSVRFRANMPNTNFYLQQHGFSVLMQSPSDMNALRNAMHGIPLPSKNADAAYATSSVNKTGGASTLAATLPPVTTNPGGSGYVNPNNSSDNLI